MVTFRGTSVPNFLVIGGMKCATTTLHQDMSKHPGIYCGQKELNALAGNSLEVALQSYQRNFKNAAPEQLLGDVSTHYSMRQEYPHVVDQARSALGPELKIVYLVREPIDRALSHHQHMMNVADGSGMGPDVNIEIRKNSTPIDYSRYADQLKVWLEHYSLDQVHLIKFEDYVSNRQIELDRLFKFLGLPNCEIEIDADGANRGHSRMSTGKITSKIWKTYVFQRLFKPFLPIALKRVMRKVFLNKAKLSEIAPTEDTVDFIFDGVKSDVANLQNLFSLPEPLWDMEAARKNHILNRCGQS